MLVLAGCLPPAVSTGTAAAGAPARVSFGFIATEDSALAGTLTVRLPAGTPDVAAAGAGASGLVLMDGAEIGVRALPAGEGLGPVMLPDGTIRPLAQALGAEPGGMVRVFAVQREVILGRGEPLCGVDPLLLLAMRIDPSTGALRLAAVGSATPDGPQARLCATGNFTPWAQG
jgi:hypothetical protein